MRTGPHGETTFDDGDTFATAMGGDTMDDEQAAAIVGMDLNIYATD